MERTRYDLVTQALHWLLAAAIATAFVSGLVAADFTGPAKRAVLGPHMALGLSILAVTIARMAWRTLAPKVRALDASPLVALSVKAGHFVLYILMLAVPLSGMAMVWAKGRDVVFLGLLKMPAPFGADHALAEMLEGGHGMLAFLLVALAALHIAAALVHQYLLRDGALSRMLPWSPARGA